MVGNGKVVGIISRANPVQALARLAEETPASHPQDEAIRRQILVEREKQPWAPRHCINVIVYNGTAELWGTIFDQREREAVRVAAENVPGIVSMKDHLVWVEPISGMVFGPPDDNSSDQERA